MSSKGRCSPAAPTTILVAMRGCLVRRVTTEALSWLDQQIELQSAARDERKLAMAFGLASRRIRRADLGLTPTELSELREHRPNWQPDRWSTDEMARVALLLATWHDDAASFASLIGRLCATAELGEHVAIIKGLAVFPAADLLAGPARDAARSSIQPVFEAIASFNPYPSGHFDDAAFNHLVVKCAFSGVSLTTVVGLEDRRSDSLIQMLRDLASERRAAGREVPVEVTNAIDGRFPS